MFRTVLPQLCGHAGSLAATDGLPRTVDIGRGHCSYCQEAHTGIRPPPPSEVRDGDGHQRTASTRGREDCSSASWTGLLEAQSAVGSPQWGRARVFSPVSRKEPKVTRRPQIARRVD